MKGFLHFVGRSHYGGEEGFIKEALAMGVQRRILPWQLKRMSWGDRIWLAFGGDNGVAKVFGYFFVEGIACSDAVARHEKVQAMVEQVTGSGWVRRQRGCGVYLEGPTYTLNCTVREFAEVVEQMDVARKELFVKGKLHLLQKPVYLVGQKFVRLAYIPVDDDQMEAWAKTAEKETLPAIGLSDYKVPATPGNGKRGGEVTSLAEYERAKEKSAPKYKVDLN